METTATKCDKRENWTGLARKQPPLNSWKLMTCVNYPCRKTESKCMWIPHCQFISILFWLVSGVTPTATGGHCNQSFHLSTIWFRLHSMWLYSTILHHNHSKCLWSWKSSRSCNSRSSAHKEDSPFLDLCKTWLATHLIHKSKRYFLAKASMDQLGMWCLFLVPNATIVKLPKGGCCVQDSSCVACHCLWV